MDTYKVQILETAVAFAILLVLKLIFRYFVKLTIVNAYFKNAEKKDVLKLINLLLFVIFCLIIVAIWSVRQENILIFASSLLTVLGVAMFAEMSILSNITACLILFFHHPLKVGNTIILSYDGKEIEGELIEISYFFVFIKVSGKGVLTIPNALLLKSSFIIVDK
jgi:small-conductance mechanosensitive channel